MRFLSHEWIGQANNSYAEFPISGRDKTCRIELILHDPPAEVPDRIVMAVDTVSGRLHFDARPDAAAGTVTLRLPRIAAAHLLLGSPLERVEVFGRDDVEAEGYFVRLFFVDRVLQQDTGRVLAALRLATTDLPPGLGGVTPCPPAVPGPAEDAEAVAVADQSLPSAMRAIRAELGQTTAGAQLYVSHQARPVASVGLGDGRPGVPFRHDSPTLWYCCAKPVMSVALGQLWEAGRLDPYARISAYLPHFTGAGREDLTIYDVLTHTTPVPTGMDPLHGSLTAPEEVRRRRAATVAPASMTGGRRINYSQWWGWTVLAQVVEVVDGRRFPQYLAEEVIEPCGLTGTRVCLTDDEYSEMEELLPLLYITGDGRAPQPIWWFSSRSGTTQCLPGVNMRGPMADLGRFMEMLMAGGLGAGGRVIAPPTVAALTARHRVGCEDGFGNADWGLGFRLECRQIRADLTSFSSYSSARSYGHDGLWTAVAFADPDASLVVALHLNGKTDHDRHRRRMRDIVDAIYRDLRLDR